jgi:xanthine dehydrogenase YagS FAD-binding subunit
VNAFAYLRPADIDAALRAKATPGAMFIGGGTNLLDLVKSDIEYPATLVDLNGLDLAKIEALPDGGLRIGALARNSDMAAHAQIRSRYPLLSQAIVAGASPQLRNMATAGGNLLQRTRCYYFVDPAFGTCNKKVPGSGCAALHGQQRLHAIFGASAHCIATNPSDMNVALAALEARVRVRGPHGERSIAFADFHRLPGEQPQHDTTLAPDELILSVDLPKQGYAAHSHYLKIRDRASFAFALVSVAAALDIDGGVVRDARIALGGVAHKPWRATATEQRLAGQRLDAALVREAADAAVADAKTFPGNAFKKTLVPRAIVRAVQAAGARA